MKNISRPVINIEGFHSFPKAQNSNFTSSLIDFKSCVDPKFDMKDTPKHPNADKYFLEDLKDITTKKQYDNLKLDDANAGFISVSDYLAANTPDVLALSENISDCILANKPTLTIFGEEHKLSPDIVMLKTAKNLQDKGEKVHFLLEIPFNLEAPLKQYLKKEITEEQFNESIIKATVAQQEVLKLTESQKTDHCAKIKNVVLPFASQLEKMGINFSCIDDALNFKITSNIDMFNPSKTVTTSTLQPCKAERDKRIFERSEKAIKDNQGIKLMKIGMAHASKVANKNTENQLQYGINSQYTAASLLIDKYGKDNISTMSFSQIATNQSGYKFSDFDRVFKWADHPSLSKILEMKIYADAGIETGIPNFTEDYKILKSLTE